MFKGAIAIDTMFVYIFENRSHKCLWKFTKQSKKAIGCCL